MIRAFIFKEWLKLRWAFLGLSLLGFSFLLFTGHGLYREFAAGPAVPIWQNLVERQVMFFSGLKYFGVLAGLVTALVQWLPDTPNRGLRLQLHLPFPQMQGVGILVLCGALTVIVVCGLMIAALLLITQYFFPWPVVRSVGLTVFPWMLAGLPVYAMAGAALLDISLLRRVIYGIIGWQMASLYLAGCGYAGFEGVLGLYGLMALLMLFAPFISAERFKRGTL
ncbi:hypothetical protein LZ24_01313 [Desulfobotulus alkaliphilus]|uniref:ABC-2 family transporter n=1 Tax=Desulfobotulus alkaliphilus TaxID=622671 RepID=A0A562RVU1_9BACT|nr:hypothetical protein [Desulfobotulus alkaliphilus]TWI73225.1 hypothetical protein LZ24_01313 [Desulfobotulus alkaliphilus]